VQLGSQVAAIQAAIPPTNALWSVPLLLALRCCGGGTTHPENACALAN